MARTPKIPPPPRLGALPNRIFASRWLQLPLYPGPILAHFTSGSTSLDETIVSRPRLQGHPDQ